MESIEGKITALSHIIYINPKSIFFEVCQETERWNVMITNRNQLKDWKELIAIRQWIRIDCLKRVSLHSTTDYKISILETTDCSTLTPSPKGFVKNPTSNILINYEGEVTDDTYGPSGFYRLDDTLTLCLAYAKLVTNIPIIRKGDRIVLHESHRIRFGEDIVMYICGRGYLVNKSVHKDNEALFPKPAKEDSRDLIQHLALETNCSIGILYSLYHLSQRLRFNFCDDILPLASVTRKSASVNQKGVLSVLVDHFSSSIMRMEPKARSFSREFLSHDSAGCAPSSKDPHWNVELWALDPHQIERRCNSRKLWVAACGLTSPSDSAADGSAETPRYWEHDVAPIDSRSDRICVLVGVLSFRHGRWELRDRCGSVEVVSADRDCLQFRERLVFTTRFVVHRETFTADHSTHRRIYVSTDAFQAASLPLSRPDGVMEETNEQVDEGVRFLVLNKSMPQSVYLSLPAIRHVFGYLVFASLHVRGQEEEAEGGPAHKRLKMGRVSAASRPEEDLPAKCLFFFHDDHPGLTYPEVVEGKVYLIRVARRKLFSNPISPASLKDVPLHALNLKDRVFLVPDQAAVYRVPYHLPKSESFIRRDVLRADECLSLDEVGSIVSLRGRIVDRMHMEARFSSERIGQTFTTHQGTWLGIPGNKKIVLKIGDDRNEASFGSKIDVYFNLREGQVYPLGLFRGTEVELTLLCLRKTQKNGRLYCTSTALTAIRILKIGRQFGGEARPRMELVRASCLGRRFLSQLDEPGLVRPKDVFRCLVTVRYIHKLSISAVCPGCGTAVTHGTCTYVGCRWNQPGFKVDVKAWCTVEDGSGQALMFLSGECCRKWLKLPAGVWRALQDQVLPHEGEFLYLSSRNRPPSTSLAGRILLLYCDLSLRLRRPLHVMADRFVNNDVNSGAYYLKDHPSKRLFCLHVDEMDPSACAVELSERGGKETSPVERRR